MKRQWWPFQKWSRFRFQLCCQLAECCATTWFCQFDGRLRPLWIWPELLPARDELAIRRSPFAERATPLLRVMLPLNCRNPAPGAETRWPEYTMPPRPKFPIGAPWKDENPPLRPPPKPPPPPRKPPPPPLKPPPPPP